MTGAADSWLWIVPRIYWDRRDAEERAEVLAKRYPDAEFRVRGNPKAGFGVQRKQQRGQQ